VAFKRRERPPLGGVLKFGKKHYGRTLEYILFHNPGYIEFMLNNHIVPRNMPSRFWYLVTRAMHLKIPGRCPWYCKGKKAVTRMCLHATHDGRLGSVTFDCDTCEPDNMRWTMVRPSFLVSTYFHHYDKTGGRILVDAIRSAYDLPDVLRQDAMETFFENDDNFNMIAVEREMQEHLESAA